jgi:hypothetical protein
MRVVMLVLALLAGCRSEGEANAPGRFRPAPRYSASLDATYSGCLGPMMGYTGEVVLTARRRRVELALTLTPKDVFFGMGELTARPMAPEFRTCRWVGSGTMKQGRWVVSLARVDAAEVDVCGERGAALEFECASIVVPVDGSDATVLTCSLTSPERPAEWLFRDGFMLTERPLHARVEGYMGGTVWTLTRSPRSRVDEQDERVVGDGVEVVEVDAEDDAPGDR